jgi:septal ring factor EnvC (AmiA/AmiB activator)
MFMKPYGGYVPKDQLNGEDQYVEFYKVEEVDREIEGLEAAIEKRSNELRKREEEIKGLKKESEKLEAKLRTAEIIAMDLGREIAKARNEVTILQEALEFYADRSTYSVVSASEGDPQHGTYLIEADRGKKAREALKTLQEHHS